MNAGHIIKLARTSYWTIRSFLSSLLLTAYEQSYRGHWCPPKPHPPFTMSTPAPCSCSNPKLSHIDEMSISESNWLCTRHFSYMEAKVCLSEQAWPYPQVASLRFTPGNLLFHKVQTPITPTKVSVVKRKPGLYFGLVSSHVSFSFFTPWSQRDFLNN